MSYILHVYGLISRTSRNDSLANFVGSDFRKLSGSGAVGAARAPNFERHAHRVSVYLWLSRYVRAQPARLAASASTSFVYGGREERRGFASLLLLLLERSRGQIASDQVPK